MMKGNTLKKFFYSMILFILTVPMLMNAQETRLTIRQTNKTPYLIYNQLLNYRVTINQEGNYKYILWKFISNTDSVSLISDYLFYPGSRFANGDSVIWDFKYQNKVFQTGLDTTKYLLEVYRYTDSGRYVDVQAEPYYTVPEKIYFYPQTSLVNEPIFDYFKVGSRCSLWIDNPYLNGEEISINQYYVNDKREGVAHNQPFFINHDTTKTNYHFSNNETEIYFYPKMIDIGKVYFNIRIKDVYEFNSDEFKIGFNGIDEIIDSLNSNNVRNLLTIDSLNKVIVTLNDTITSLRNYQRLLLTGTENLQAKIDSLNNLVDSLYIVLNKTPYQDTIYVYDVKFEDYTSNVIEGSLNEMTGKKLYAPAKELQVHTYSNELTYNGNNWSYKLYDLSGNLIYEPKTYFNNVISIKFDQVPNGTYLMVFMIKDNDTKYHFDMRVILIDE